MADRTSRKTPGQGSISAWTDAQKTTAAEKAQRLVDDGRSITQARKEVAAEYRVSDRTIQRWAVAVGKPVHQDNPKDTRHAREAIRQFTGADYRSAALRLMRITLEGIDEVEERRREQGSHGVEGINVASKVSVMLTRAILLEKALTEMGFGVEQPSVPGERSDEEPLTLEEQVAVARALRDKMQDDAEAKRVAAREKGR